MTISCTKCDRAGAPVEEVPPSVGAVSTIEDLPPFVYGTTRLGADDVPLQQQAAMARAALDRGLWLHTSTQYGHALQVLGEAIAEHGGQPSTIVKLGGGTADDVRTEALANSGPLGIDTIALGQLSPVDGLEDALVAGGSALDGLRRLRTEGIVGGFVLEIFPWTSAKPLEALRAGRLDDLVDAFILYINPLQRFASNELWDELIARGSTLISMRTVAGSDVRALADVPGAAWLPYLQERAVQVAPIFERSGVASWVEFCARWSLGMPGVVSTVGSTVRTEHLDAYVAATSGPVEPLPQDVVEEITALQRRWSDEVDVHAEPWTM